MYSLGSKASATLLLTALVMLTVMPAFTPEASAADEGMTDAEIIQTAYEAYEYAMPLMIMDLTFTNMTNTVKAGTDRAPFNQFSHANSPASADDRGVVKVNVDTLYSMSCMDLSDEPIVFSKPETERYSSMAVFDAYTNIAHILGSGGMDDGREAVYVFYGPDYKGGTYGPDGAAWLPLPTNLSWMIVRTEYGDENDLADIEDIQSKLTLVPLSSYGDKSYVPPDGSYSEENDYVTFDKIKEIDIVTFFNTFNSLASGNLGTEEDAPALERFKRINVGAGLTFDLGIYPEAVRNALTECPEVMIAKTLAFPVLEGSDHFFWVNGWLYTGDTMAKFGTDYSFRAYVALTSLGANPAEMAVYPSTSTDSAFDELNGKNDYVIHFENGQLPPCDAFWSITVYDEDGFLVEGVDRYAVRSRDILESNEDGSIDILLRHGSPGKDAETNWLPVPDGPFQLALRIYLPAESVLDLTWEPPEVNKQSSPQDMALVLILALIIGIFIAGCVVCLWKFKLKKAAG